MRAVDLATHADNRANPHPDPLPEGEGSFWLTEPFHSHATVSAVVFSGGVAEYIDGREERDFGDMGPALGAAIRSRIAVGELPAPVRPAVERIRATVFGASQSTIQLSGNAVALPNRRLLPLRNVPVLALPSVDDLAEQIRRAHQRLDLQEGAQKVALCLAAPPAAEALLEAMPHSVANKLPLIVIAPGAARVASAIGQRATVVGLEGIELREFDYVDLGAPLQPSGRVPVTVKSLVFPSPQT